MSFSNKLYSKLPLFLQNLAISVYGYYWKNRRYGGEFKKEILNFKSRENFNKEQWINYQNIELRKILIHAFDTVPYYNNLYSKAGFKREDFLNFSLSDLNKLPFLEKDDLRKFGKTDLLSNVRAKGKFYSSSGSTGTPTQIYFSREFQRKWHAAYEARVRNWAGVNYDTPRGMIGGRRVLPSSKNNKPFYRYNLAEKQTYFSAYHISRENVKNYVKGIRDNNVNYMVGYATSNFLLAQLIQKEGIKTPRMKAVITSSEKLTEEMRDTFKQVYNCKTYDGYSGMEACGLISENHFGDFLFSPDTGVLEVLDKQGSEVQDGEEGEIVLTGLLNFDQPLIRYRIGDRAKKSKNQKSKSGLEMPLIDEIIGRTEDVVITFDGRKMVRFHSLFYEIKGLLLSQIVQESLNTIKVNLVVDKLEYKKKSENLIKQRLISQIGENINVIFNYLDDIPDRINGKYKSVISKLKDE